MLGVGSLNVPVICPSGFVHGFTSNLVNRQVDHFSAVSIRWTGYDRGPGPFGMMEFSNIQTSIINGKLKDLVISPGLPILCSVDDTRDFCCTLPS